MNFGDMSFQDYFLSGISNKNLAQKSTFKLMGYTTISIHIFII